MKDNGGARSASSLDLSLAFLSADSKPASGVSYHSAATTMDAPVNQSGTARVYRGKSGA